MIEMIVLFVLGLIWIIFATIQDLKTTEVSNWLNFSLVIFALGFRFFYCLFENAANGFTFFYQGLIGFGIFFVLGNLFYYSKMFAGGDAKLFIALGAVLPFAYNFYSNVRIFTWFLFLFLISGAIYTIFIAGYFAAKNFENFKKDFKKRVKDNKKIFYLALIFGILFFILGFFENFIFLLAIFILLIPGIYISAKSIDETCMIKLINVSKLREGDWLYQDVKVGKKILKANWNGLTKEEISLLKKKLKKVKIRQGIPFVPVFLIAYLLLGIVLMRLI